MARGKKKKILVVTPTYPQTEKSSSVPGFIRDLCTALAEQDYLVDVLAPYYEGAKPIVRYNSITVYRFRYALPGMHAKTPNAGTHSTIAANHVPPIWRPLYRFFLHRKLAKLVALYDYEAIHAHWLIPQGWAAAKLRGSLEKPIPLICSAHGMDLREAEGFDRTARQLALKHADQITVSSRQAQEQLVQISPQSAKKISVVHIGVDLSTLFCRMPYVKRQKHALLFVGRLTKETGLSTLIKAMPLIQAQVPEIRLFIVGDGPERRALEEEAKEYGCYHNLQFIGNLAPPAVALFYNKARMLVVPTYSTEPDGYLNEEERMAQVCVEAMGCKCPVVASGLKTIKDIVIDGQTGKVFQAGSSEDLAKQVLWILNHPQETKEFVSSAHKHVQGRFDLGEMGECYLTLFRSNKNL